MNNNRLIDKPDAAIQTGGLEQKPQSGNIESVPETRADTPPKKEPGAGGLLLGLLFWAGLIVFWASKNDTAREFLIHWWWAFLGALVLVVGFVLSGWFRRWFRAAAAQKQTAVVVFVVIPFLLACIGGIVFLPPPHQIIVLRIVFLIAVCLLPALIYYLFIATRQISLLNDYFVNLARLGLLQRRLTPAADSEIAKAECRVRLLNYVQKFEALYGPLPAELENSLTQADDPLAVLVTPEWRRTVSSGIVKIFTAETAIPVVLATVLTALGWLLALPPSGVDWFSMRSQTSLWGSALMVDEHPMVYAFLGAYFFSLQMLFRRYVREDLRKSAYLAVSLRIILAVIGTWAAIVALETVGKVDPDSRYLLLLGFIIGVFPRIAWQFIQGATKGMMQKLRMSAVLPSLESRLPLSDLDGLTVWHEARLEEEDIENVPNMASAEIVDLMISTRFPPDRIIDWVDQAILFTYLGPDQTNGERHEVSRRELLRRQGIRTATSLMQAFHLSHRKPRKDGDDVEKLLSNASYSHVRALLDAIGTDSNVRLICAWRGIPFTVPTACAVI
jgi:hypothetical protein